MQIRSGKKQGLAKRVFLYLASAKQRKKSAIAGLLLVNSFAMIVALKSSNFSLLIPAFIGELSFCSWLLIKGVNKLDIQY
jgi:hypothetical protein